MNVGEFEIKDKDLAARIAKLRTPHGFLETPAILPVIDIQRQELPLNEIVEVGFEAVITNAYLLWKRMQRQAEEQGVHRILGFDGIVMTDSGAYQLLRYGDVEVTQREIVEFQKKIGSDIAVILDVPTGSKHTWREARECVVETLRRAQEAIDYIDAQDRVWVLPIQGGPFRDLVEYSARESTRLSKYYHVYALGSPTPLLERYEYEHLIDLVFTARSILPLSKPLHLFGAGHPMILPFMVALGVDMFDSASYILYARDDRYMTLTHTYRLQDLDYLPCSCPVCTKYTPQEIMELPKWERVRLLAKHNLYVLKQAINEIKVAIREGRLWELLEERSRAHPSLYRAFKRLTRYVEWMEKLSPRVKGGEVHGLFLYSSTSLQRPELIRHRKYVLERYKPRYKNVKLVLYPGDPDVKPLTRSSILRHLKRSEGEKTHYVAYIPFLGIVPEELSETYPLSQFEAPREVDDDVLARLVEDVKAYIVKYGRQYSGVKLCICPRLEWSLKLASMLVDYVDEVEVFVDVA